MSTEFALDLRLARRKTGLTQRDIAHLLAKQVMRVSMLEHGKSLPTLDEIVMLSLIFDRSFESLFTERLAHARTRLQRRVLHMPEGVRDFTETFNREASIERLARRLTEEPASHDKA